MVDLDLTVAVEAAGRAHHEDWLKKEHVPDVSLPDWDELPNISKHFVREHVLPAVTAAAPVIAAQVLRWAADKVDAGPTFPLPPGVISQLLREYADDEENR